MAADLCQLIIRLEDFHTSRSLLVKGTARSSISLPCSCDEGRKPHVPRGLVELLGFVMLELRVSGDPGGQTTSGTCGIVLAGSVCVLDGTALPRVDSPFSISTEKPSIFEWSQRETLEEAHNRQLCHPECLGDIGVSSLLTGHQAEAVKLRVHRARGGGAQLGNLHNSYLMCCIYVVWLRGRRSACCVR